ncbi:hypothetical protein [Amycolatopsis palatopharyngis]|uniref:hypothetical protein n=1 Tax=Amycolatopsis palatopharyngis TaxID=187982 RepID=UPI0013BE9097|nr:hypothetical protein [Amycolatopsis palatopharyngis]
MMEEEYARLIGQVAFLAGYYDYRGSVPVELLQVALNDGDVRQAVKDHAKAEGT